jgi:AcrR family transcriptional regulator
MEATDSKSDERRSYRMRARAESTAATRQAISSAFLQLFTELHYEEITLDLVADRASVSTPTVFRHFGSKDELFTSVAAEFAATEGERRAPPTGGVAPAIRALVAHYERAGEVVLRLLAQEERLPALREAADVGRRIHSEWVDLAFAPYLELYEGGERRCRHGQLVALTDIYVWKILRHDRGFGRRSVEKAITQMVCSLLKGDA